MRSRETKHANDLQTVRPLFLLLTSLGCQPAADPTPTANTSPADLGDLKSELDTVLEATYQRKLNLQDHAAWQILHGALAFQQDFQVERQRDGETVSAVEYLLDGGRMKGWTTEPGVVLNDETQQRGLRAILESGTKTGQGHSDQWLAVLAQCGLPPDQPLQVEGDAYTMGDFVAQVQWDVPRNLDREYSWTLIGLTTYCGTDANWQASDGQQWSIERLMEVELEQDLNASACGGTHRLIGITMALNRHLSQGGELEGVWKEADETIQKAIANAQENQNPDGSFSTSYFARPGSSPDLAQNLGASGHILEFLVLAMTDDQLDQEWVKRAVFNLCSLFKKTQEIPLECGALYHAAHGLVLYRSRVYGERRYSPGSDVASESPESSSADAAAAE